MQLALVFTSPAPLPAVSGAINNPVMASSGSDGAERQATLKQLRGKALRLLTTREHSREELLGKLAQARARRAQQDADARESRKDDIERLLDELAVAGWQSDERYAEALVRRLGGQASRRFIAEKLAQAGIKKDAAETAIGTIEADDSDVAQALWSRRFGGEPPVDDKARQRQIRFLLSRGFHLGDAFKIVPRAATPMSPVHGSSLRRRGDVALDNDGDGKDAKDSDAPVGELTRTSSRWRTSPADADASTAEVAGELTRRAPWPNRTQTRKAGGFGRRTKPARPWGARNDADPSDE